MSAGEANHENRGGGCDQRDGPKKRQGQQLVLTLGGRGIATAYAVLSGRFSLKCK
jgi:hypothetical protein